MSDDSGVLSDRRQALEEEFFRKKNERLAAELRLKRITDEAKDGIGEASGIRDEAVLDKLVELGIGAETLTAMTLVPLVEVAWADGQMDAKERHAILKGAEAQGIGAGTPSGMLLAWRSTDGSLRHRLPVPRLPDFVSNLPGSPMRQALASIVEVRRMLPVARIDARQATLRIEDDRGKTVARVILEHGTVEDAEGEGARGRLPATVQLFPLRGYDAVARRIARYLENDLRLRAAEPARLNRVLAAVGRAPVPTLLCLP